MTTATVRFLLLSCCLSLTIGATALAADPAGHRSRPRRRTATPSGFAMRPCRPTARGSRSAAPGRSGSRPRAGRALGPVRIRAAEPGRARLRPGDARGGAAPADDGARRPGSRLRPRRAPHRLSGGSLVLPRARSGERRRRRGSAARPVVHLRRALVSVLVAGFALARPAGAAEPAGGPCRAGSRRRQPPRRAGHAVRRVAVGPRMEPRRRTADVAQRGRRAPAGLS